MNEVINQIGGSYYIINYYGDSDSMFIHRKYWKILVENGFDAKDLGLGKNEYGDSGMFKCMVSSPENRVLLSSAETTFEGYSEEQRMIKLNEFTPLSERKTISGRFSIDCTKSFERIRILHRKRHCWECKGELLCINCVETRKMDCFYFEMERVNKPKKSKANVFNRY